MKTTRRSMIIYDQEGHGMDKKCEMFKALVDGRVDDLLMMLHAGADVDVVADRGTTLTVSSRVVEGDTLLHVALRMENMEAFESLLRVGANFNVSTSDGFTPLQLASHKGLYEQAFWLLDHGANFNTTDCFGLTPLHYTSHPLLLERILAKGVSVNLVAHSTGWTPLHYAAYHDQSDKTRLLLSHGADHAASGKYGETPLHLLVALRHHEVYECGSMLLDAGAEIDAQDDEGNTPFHWALGIDAARNWMHSGNPKAIAFLLDHKANVRIKNHRGLTPVALAWRHSKEEYRKPFQERLIKPSLGDRMRNLV